LGGAEKSASWPEKEAWRALGPFGHRRRNPAAIAAWSREACNAQPCPEGRLQRMPTGAWQVGQATSSAGSRGHASPQSEQLTVTRLLLLWVFLLGLEMQPRQTYGTFGRFLDNFTDPYC
jgi:hypothetical protein